MKTEFFYGANTSKGFISYFKEMYDENFTMYIIKGGPGTGKSTLMKSIMQKAEQKGYDVTAVKCSSDPNSLDGVIIPELKVCIADGTSPHTLEPQFPGVVEKIINLSDCWDENILKENRKKIIDLTKKCSDCHRKSMQFLSAAATLKKDSIRLVNESVDMKKLRRFSVRFANKNFQKPNGKLGSEYKRFLTALTPQGIIYLSDTVEKMCDDITVLKDDEGGISSVILHEIRSYAMGCGYDVISCRCPMMPDLIQHIIIPDLKIAVVTGNGFHNKKYPKQNTVNVGRFMKETTDNTNRFAYNIKAQSELVNTAMQQMKKAKAFHDELEDFYKNAVDFSMVTEKQNEIEKEIFTR